MRYTNLKTGAVVDSSSTIKGENWTVVEPIIEQKKPVKKVIKKETRKDKE